MTSGNEIDQEMVLQISVQLNEAFWEIAKKMFPGEFIQTERGLMMQGGGHMREMITALLNQTANILGEGVKCGFIDPVEPLLAKLKANILSYDADMH